MDEEIKEILRLAGIKEAIALPGIAQAVDQQDADPSGNAMEQMRQLISGVDQALAGNDIGRAKAILRDMYRLTGGTDEGY